MRLLAQAERLLRGGLRLRTGRHGEVRHAAGVFGECGRGGDGRARGPSITSGKVVGDVSKATPHPAPSLVKDWKGATVLPIILVALNLRREQRDRSGEICSPLSWFELVEVEDGVSEPRSTLRWSLGNGRSAPAGGRGGRQTGDRGPIALSALQRVPISAVIRENAFEEGGGERLAARGLEGGGGDILASGSAGGGRTTQIAAGNCRDEKPRRRSRLGPWMGDERSLIDPGGDVSVS